MRFKMTAQIRQGAALPDKVIHHDIIGTGYDFAIKMSWMSQTGVAIRASMADDVGLDDVFINSPFQTVAQFIGQGFGNSIDPGSFVSMDAHQNRAIFSNLMLQQGDLDFIKGSSDQPSSGGGIAGFSRQIIRVTFDDLFIGMDKHIGKFAPNRAWECHHDGCLCGRWHDLNGEPYPFRQTAATRLN